MVDKISELPAAAALDGTEIVPITQGPGGAQVTRQMPASAVRRRHTGFLAGRHWNIFGSSNCVQGGTAVLPSVDTALCYPFICEDDAVDWIGLALRITTVGAGSAFKSALYAQDPATLRPSTLLRGDNAGVSTASSAVITTSTWAATFRGRPGAVYFAVLKATGTLPQTTQFANTNTLGQWLIGGVIGGSLGGTPQGWGIASPYADAWGNFDPAAAGWAVLNGAQPIPWLAT